MLITFEKHEEEQVNQKIEELKNKGCIIVSDTDYDKKGKRVIGLETNWNK